MKQGRRIVAMLLALAMILTTVLAVPGSAVTAYAAAKKSLTVSTQKQLEAALKASGVSKITIKTSKKKSFTIPAKSYRTRTLVVDAPKASVTNSAKWGDIAIKNASSFSEKAKKNEIVVSDSKLTLKVAKGATVKSVTLTQKSALTISGETKSKVPVIIKAKAAGSKLTANVAVKVEANAKATLVVNKGAEKSSVVEKNISAKISVKNETKATISVTNSKGVVTKVAPKEEPKEDEKPSDETPGQDNKPDDDKKDDDKKDEGTTPSNPSPSGPSTPSTPSGPSTPSTPSIPSDPGPGSDIPSTPTYTLMKVSTVAEFESAIQQTNEIQLKSDLTGDISLEYGKSAELTIDFQSNVINGSLTLSAPNATSIKLLDAAGGGDGAIITGDLTVDAPKAHVENNIKVNGTVVIKGVANSTFAAKDDAGKYSVEGPGRLAFPKDTVATAEVEIKTDAPVLLDGTIETVKVSDAKANVEVVAGSSISEVKIKETASMDEESSVKISGAGSVQSVDAKAPVVVEVVKVEEVKASAPVVINTAVPTVVVESDEAKVTVGSDAAVTNIAVAAVVTQVEVAGEGTVKAIDTTAAEAAGVGTVAIKVADEAKVSEVVATDSSKVSVETAGDNKPVVKTVTSVSLSTEGATVDYSSTDSLDLSNVSLTITYSTDDSETIPVLSGMVTGFPTAADYVTWEGPQEKELTVTYGGKTASYGITFTATLADRLAAAAKSGIKTVECSSTYTIPKNDFVTIPKGVTLELVGAKVLEIEAGGALSIEGTLQTESEEAIIFHPVDGYTAFSLLFAGGSWVNGSVTHKNTNNESGQWQLLYTDRRDSDEGDPNMLWLVRGELSIFGSEFDWESEASKYLLNSENAKVLLNDKVVDETTPYEKLQFKLRWADEGDVVICDDVIDVPEENWLQIPQNVTLKLSESGKLVVTKWGGMNIWNGAILDVTANEEAFLESMKGTIGLRNGTWICRDTTYFSEQSFLHANGSQGVEKCWRVDKDLVVTSASLSEEAFSGNKSILASVDAKIYLNDKVVREASACEKLQIQLNSAAEGAEEGAVIECSEVIEVVSDLYIPSGVTLKITENGSLRMNSGSKLRISENACLDTSEASKGGIDSSNSVTVMMSGTWKQSSVTYSTTSGANESAGVFWQLSDSSTNPISCLLDMDLYIIADEKDLSSIEAISFSLLGGCESAEIILNNKPWKTLPVSTE